MILDEIAALTPPAFAQGAADELEEPQGAVARAVRDLVAGLLAALSRRTDDAAAFAALFAILDDAENARLADGLGENAKARALNAQAFIDALFGANAAPVTAAIARGAGVRPPSAATLAPFAATLAMAGLARKISAEGLTAETLKKKLGAERDAILRALPYEASSALKFSTAMDVVREKPADLKVGARKARVPAWAWALLVAAVLAIAAWIYLRSAEMAPLAAGLVEAAPDLPAEAEAPTAPYAADEAQVAGATDRSAAPEP